MQAHVLAPGARVVAARSVEVRLLALDAPGRGGAADAALLDADERAHAARFAFEAPRRRFTARRAALRRLLAERAGCSAAAIRYAAGPHGRPRALGLPLDFSLSHRGERALIAIADAPGERIGVDIEQLDARHAEAGMLARHVDALVLARVDAALRAGDLHPFYRWWTVVEAVGKARGHGITEDAPPQACDAWLQGVQLADDQGTARHWALHTWQPEPGCIATLALPVTHTAVCLPIRP